MILLATVGIVSAFLIGTATGENLRETKRLTALRLVALAPLLLAVAAQVIYPGLP